MVSLWKDEESLDAISLVQTDSFVSLAAVSIHWCKNIVIGDLTNSAMMISTNLLVGNHACTARILHDGWWMPKKKEQIIFSIFQTNLRFQNLKCFPIYEHANHDNFKQNP